MLAVMSVEVSDAPLEAVNSLLQCPRPQLSRILHLAGAPCRPQGRYSTWLAPVTHGHGPCA